MPNTNITPTKSNLLATKRSLALAKLGFELLDRKRVIMMREMTGMLGDVQDVQDRIDSTFESAYTALQHANLTIGASNVAQIAGGMDAGDDAEVQFRSVMGIDLPTVKVAARPIKLTYGFIATNDCVDDAYLKFEEVRQLTARMAQIENSVYRLAYAIKQAQKRSNALQNIVIPRLEEQVAYITAYLEEKERESFTTMKVLKRREN